MGPYVIEALWEHYMNYAFICPALDYCEPFYEDIDI